MLMISSPDCADASREDSKRKLDHDDKIKKKTKLLQDIPDDNIQSAWSHYRSYLDSEDELENGNEPDFDELNEAISLLEEWVEVSIEDVDIKSLSKCRNAKIALPTIESLLPYLLSMAYVHLGDLAITQGFEDETLGDNVEQYLHKSLKYCPMNAAALSMLANYERMNLLSSLRDICSMYELAATNAKALRDFAVSALSEEPCDATGKGTEESGSMFKEWIELLILQGMAGAEFIGDDEDEEMENENTDDDNKNNNGEGAFGDDEHKQNRKAINGEGGAKEPEESEEFSTSDVEATSSFMAALLSSTLKLHDNALNHLTKFQFSYRIHPNVWMAATDVLLEKKTSKLSKVLPDDKMVFEPKSFTGDVLPPHLYDRLCAVFSPGAAFWRESDYQNRGYYSFFEDITKESQNKPKNLIEDLVVNHLLPLAQESVPSDDIVGYEFWAHTRPLKANLGHQLHFDTDEALLAQEKKVTHPVVSSVLYLTGNKGQNKNVAGSTVVFSQVPDDSEVATKAYISQAQDKRYMIFPGCCLHGVLPCSGAKSADSVAEKEIPVERLTFMVGFWTRRVPDQMKERHLYGPCGPLPEANEENTWVSEIEQGYGCNDSPKCVSSTEKNITSNVLPSVSPAWEDISSFGSERMDMKLVAPPSLDHRFFVKNAPHCFRESLFKDESF